MICTDFSFVTTLPPTPLMGFSVGFFKTQFPLLCAWVFCLNIRLRATCVSSAHKTRTLGPLGQELQMTVSELGPLEKQTVLLNAEPSLQPSNKYCFVFTRWIRIMKPEGHDEILNSVTIKYLIEN